MKVLYVTGEAGPFAASGGLGDVMGALPHAVAEQGIEASVILPYYNTIKDIYKEKMEYVTDLSFNLSWRKTGATVYKITEGNVTYYFVENHYYFDRGRLYGEFDDAERFAFFSRAVVEFLLSTGNLPDVLHANDWQTAPVVIYLKTEYAHIEAFSSIKTVFTIHNVEYQGKFDPYILGDVFGIDGKYRSLVEYDGCINLMKGALVLTDFITTVSPNYANELEYDFFSFGLSPIIKSVKDKMVGVINGIDYGYFSPEKGGDIVAPYTARGVKGGKAKNKKALLKDLGMEYDESKPLIVMITRLTAGKGVDLVLHIIDELLSENVQMVLLGTGDKEYEDAFVSVSERHSNFKALIKFDRVISKQMYAAADLFLMPSKSEPCGLAQMIACSYGTIPVVRSVGGLRDSIIPYGCDGNNGFRFDNYNAHELLFVLKEAIELYKDRKAFSALVSSAKKSNFSWNNSAAKYIEIYNKII